MIERTLAPGKPDVRSPGSTPAHPAPEHAAPRGSIFLDNILQHLPVEAQVYDQLLEHPVLFLQGPKPAQFSDANPREPLLPAIECLLH